MHAVVHRKRLILEWKIYQGRIPPTRSQRRQERNKPRELWHQGWPLVRGVCDSVSPLFVVFRFLSKTGLLHIDDIVHVSLSLLDNLNALILASRCVS